MFYDIFEKLCAEMEVSPADVRRAVGVSQSTMASWKSRGLTPKYDTLKKLSDYFGVSVDYLQGNPHPFLVRDNDTTRQMNRKMAKKFSEELIDILKNYPHYDDLQKIDAAFHKLNSRGRKEAVKRVEELTEIPRYRASQPTQEALPAESEGADTPLPPDPGPPENDE